MNIRPATEADVPMIQEWIGHDPEHQGIAPEFFCESIPGKAEAMIFEDSIGPIFNVKLERVLRVHIQFDAGETLRTAKVLSQGFQWLLERAQNCGYSEVIFDSVSEPLIRFCEKRFHFERSPHELKVRI